METAKFTVTLTRAQLRAALIFAGDKDIRYYLNGVLLQVSEGKDARLVATDGHRCAVVTVGDHAAAVPGDYILPRDALKAIKRATRNTGDTVDLTIEGGRVVISAGADIISGGALIDGKFPDYQRIIPDPARMSGEVGSFRAEYLADIGRAAQELGDKWGGCPLLQNGPNNSGLAVFESLGLAVVVMPYRADLDARPDMSAFYPRRVFSATVETATGAQAFPCDPLQDISDKRAPVEVVAAGLPVVETTTAAPARDDVTLSSGRTIRHTRAPNGSQDATPTTGPDSMTESEWAEYCAIISGNRPEPTKPAADVEYLAYLASMQAEPEAIAA